MKVSTRLSLVAAVAVAVAVALASLGSYFAVAAKLRGQIDSSLQHTVADIQYHAPPGPGGVSIVASRFRGDGMVQLVADNGAVQQLSGAPGTGFAPSSSQEDVAAGKRPGFLTDQRVNGGHMRVITAPVAPGVAVQVARPLDETDHTLAGLRVLLIAIALGGCALAAFLGAGVSRAALAPVRRFTRRTESVASSPNLGRRLEVTTTDELGRLAQSINSTLEALEESAHAQRQLVADASHELRTPLASLRTNIEVLQRGGDLSDADRQELLADIIEQLNELTALVGDVVELARQGERGVDGSFEDVRLDELVGEAVKRIQRHAPDIRFQTNLESCVVQGSAQRLDRAIANLLDNAAKWSPSDKPVEVTVHHGELSVRDYGPGFGDDDLPFVFDRFYRAPAARRLPGSGLGLAIVRQVAEAHGAAVTAENAEGGGARLRLTFFESS